MLTGLAAIVMFLAGIIRLGVGLVIEPGPVSDIRKTGITRQHAAAQGSKIPQRAPSHRTKLGFGNYRKPLAMNGKPQLGREFSGIVVITAKDDLFTMLGRSLE